LYHAAAKDVNNSIFRVVTQFDEARFPQTPKQGELPKPRLVELAHHPVATAAGTVWALDARLFGPISGNRRAWSSSTLNGLGITGTILRRIAVVVVLGATFAASAMVTVYGLFHSGQVVVPNVVGMSEAEARRAVESAGLEFKPRRVHFDTEIPAGTVTEQDPAASFPVKSGFEIKVDISKGADPTGQSEQEELPGPTNPAERPVNENTNKKKKAPNANANANANTNAKGKGNANGNAKPADTSEKPKPPSDEDRDDAKPKPPSNKTPDSKPKPAKPKPPPPAR